MPTYLFAQAKHLSTCHGPDKSLQSYIFDHFNAATSAAAPKNSLSQISGSASFRPRTTTAAPTNSTAAYGNLPDIARQSYSLYHACATHSAASAAVRAFSGVLTGQLPETVLLQQQLQLAAVHTALHAIPRTTATPPAGSSGVSATETSQNKSPSGGSNVLVPTELALDVFAHLFPHRPAHKLSRLRDALRLDFPGGSVNLDHLMSSWAPFKGRAEVSLGPASLQAGSDSGAGPAGSGDNSSRTAQSDVTLRTESTVSSSGPGEASGGAAGATVMGLCGMQLRAVLLEQHLEEVEASVTATAERLQQLCVVLSEASTATAQVGEGALSRAASPAVSAITSPQVLLSAFERRLGGVVGVDAAGQALCHVLGLHRDLPGCATKQENGVGGASGGSAEGKAELLRLLGGAGFMVTASQLVGKLLATLLLPGLEGPGVTTMMDLGAAVTWAGGLTQGGSVAEEGASSLPSLPSPA